MFKSTMKRLVGRVAALALVAGTGVGATTVATDLQAAETFKWKTVTLHRNGPNYEKWLWFKEQVEKRTDGRIEIELLTYPEIGLTGTDILRVMKSGLISVGEVSSGYVSGDFPMIEATDLPGMVSGLEQSKQVYDAWSEAVVEQNEDMMGGLVYSTFAWGPIYLFTREPVADVADLKGKKVRVFAPAQARLMEELGAEPLSMPISEVYSALQRGVMDGMITGTDQIAAMSAWEITPHITDIGIAPLGAYIVVSRKAWDALPQDLQTVLLDMRSEFTQVGWDKGRKTMEVGLALGQEKGMTINIPADETMRKQLLDVSSKTIMPWWFERVGREGEDRFYDIIGPIVGVKAL